MKKIINNPNDVVTEMLQGLAKANPNVVYAGEGVEVISRKEKKSGKVLSIGFQPRFDLREMGGTFLAQKVQHHRGALPNLLANRAFAV